MELLYYPDEFLTKKLDEVNFEKTTGRRSRSKKRNA